MPTINISSLAGASTLPKGSSAPINIGNATAKSFGSGNTQYLEVAPARNQFVDGESSNNLFAIPTGLWVKPIAGSGNPVNALSIGNNIREGVRGPGGTVLGDGLNTITGGREVLNTGRITNGPLTQTVNGTWIDSSGLAVIPQSSGFTDVQFVSGSGDLAATNARQWPGRIDYRLGKTNVNKTLPFRTT